MRRGGGLISGLGERISFFRSSSRGQGSSYRVQHDVEAGQQPAHEKARSHLSYIPVMLPFFWPTGHAVLRIRVVCALVCLGLAKVVTVLTPFAYRAAVDELASPSPHIPFTPIGLYFVGRFASTSLADIRDIFFAPVSQHALHASAMRTFKHLHSLSVDFHVRRRTGGLLRIIDRGTRGLSSVIYFALFSLLPTILEIIFVAALVSWLYSWEIAATIFATLVIYIFYTVVVTEWRTKFRRSMNEKENETNDRSVDSLINFEVVKLFCAEQAEADRYDQAMDSYNKASIQTSISLSVLNIGQAFIISLGIFGVMLQSAKEVTQGKSTVGDFVLLNTYLLQLSIPLNFLGSSYRMLKTSFIDMEKMFEVLEVHSDVMDRPHAVPLSVTRQTATVEFRDVCFAYPSRSLAATDSAPAATATAAGRGGDSSSNSSNGGDGPSVQPLVLLKNVSFVVHAGKTTAIVGPSGSGKSTIGKLLFRFYDIQSGEILIAGQNTATECTQSSVRMAIGSVSQDTVMFNESIAYNIRYGRPGSTQAEIEAAAKMARLHDFIMTLPKQYETVVGERGLRLSGGERQRLAIARAIIKDAPIMLFDEATSALDSHTEKDIQKELREVSRGRTTLIIAHRLSTIVDADEILVLQHGTIVERGRHDELIAKPDGEYAKMWRRQQERQQVEDKLRELADKQDP